MIRTRFAPSPTGHLHLGHAYSALFAWRAARDADGQFLLRLEDIDAGRCRAEYADSIVEDLAWLGLEWTGPVRRQSDHFDDYRAALDRLDDAGLLYPCFCTRADIRREIAAIGAAPQGPDGPIYPGICRRLSPEEQSARLELGASYALRLDMTRAIDAVGPLTWTDRAAGEQTATPEAFGDVVLARKDAPTSYHLAVTVDDALQEVTLVSRGVDLMPSTHVHRLLQALLGLPVPVYHHHPLVVGADGRRFTKRDRSLTLRALRERGASPQEVVAMTEAPSSASYSFSIQA